MKKWCLAYVVLMIMLLSCSKDDEVKLEGRWQGTMIESPSHIVQSDSLFWSFDRGVCQIQTLKSSLPHFAERIFANYILADDSIMITIPESYMYMARQNKYLDWNTTERRFAIRGLTSKSLILSVNDTIYSFRKYY